MSVWTVRVREELVRDVEVVADSKEEALDIIAERYRTCEIVLDAEDFIGHTIEIREQRT